MAQMGLNRKENLVAEGGSFSMKKIDFNWCFYIQFSIVPEKILLSIQIL